ncbi:hypothetical protein LOC67_24465 [Stieleria sp. JC731]|uniref:hypothetical protein n=1 Tax=Pirellulaceae TaxID=2691357 RepID=UPI001E379822|nr:hypothetical protein [Stieleria sp. JC731]MCC9603716.1 hypothetical protein [Stieleria sp. JC731]
MADFQQYKLRFVSALPDSVLDLMAEVTRCKSQGEERIEQLARKDFVISMALMHGEFDTEDLKRLAASVGCSSVEGSDHEIAERIYRHLIDLKIQADLGDAYTEFTKLIEAVRSVLDPVIVLRSPGSNSHESKVVGYFNPDANFETDWLVVNMSIHPNAVLQDRGVMQLRLDDYEVGSVQWFDSLPDRSKDGWFPMYAAVHEEFPILEMEDELDERFEIEFTDERFIPFYETLASWSNLMTRPGLLGKAKPESPPRFFAQLGGRHFPWVEEPEPEHQGCSVVLRTFANSEPWVEVLVSEQGEFYVTSHIT